MVLCAEMVVWEEEGELLCLSCLSGWWWEAVLAVIATRTSNKWPDV